MTKNLPVYDIVLNDDSQGVGFISLVDNPAIQVDWIKLAESIPVQINFQADKEKQMLYGPFLIPNKNIYRFDDKLGEYFVRFSKEQIVKIADKFNEDLNNKNINFQHTSEKVDAFVASNWIIEGQDKSSNFGFDLPEGSWFGGVKVKDKNFWDNVVKSGEVKGFSVEILADLELKLNDIKNKNEEMKKEIKLASVKTAEGIEIFYDGEVGVGTPLFTDAAMTIAVEDMEWILEDGTKVITKGGLVESIEAAEVSAPEEEEELAEPASPESTSLTASEISGMIDARFSDLMDEITLLKELIGQKDEAMTEYKKQVEEKFSITPAKILEKPALKLDTEFSKQEARIKELFSKSK